MSKLTPTSPLGSFARAWSGFSLRETTGREMISLSVATEQSPAFTKAFKSTFGTAPPGPATSTPGKNGRALWIGEDQYFVLIDGENPCIDQELMDQFSGSAYVTLQTDGWAFLELEGTRAYDVLERFIALDLRSAKAGFAARTSAHHIAVIFLKFSGNKFLLMTPRSSAQGFLQALVHTTDNVIGKNG